MVSRFMCGKRTGSSKSLVTEGAGVCECVWEVFGLDVVEEVALALGGGGAGVAADPTHVATSLIPGEVLLKRFGTLYA